MNTVETPVRDLRVKDKFSIKKFLTSWEMILVYILVFLNVALMFLETDIYFSSGTMPFIIRSGMLISFMVLGMTFVLLLGCIDVSVASIMIVSCMVMGLVSGKGVPDWLTVLCGLFAGAVCGAFNGVLVAKFKMPSVIVTIATSMLFRGIAEIILNGEAVDTFPKWFSALSWHDLGGKIPYSMMCFLVVALILGFILAKTKFGRTVYVIGNAETTAKYSAVKVDLIKITVFTLMGVTAALSGILFAGRLGGITSSMGKGYELQVIAVAVLGGVSTNGGKGKIFGPVVAVFIMAFLNKTLDLIGVHANIQKIITGVILLVVVMIPVIGKTISEKKGKKQVNLIK